MAPSPSPATNPASPPRPAPRRGASCGRPALRLVGALPRVWWAGRRGSLVGALPCGWWAPCPVFGGRDVGASLVGALPCGWWAPCPVFGGRDVGASLVGALRLTSFRAPTRGAPTGNQMVYKPDTHHRRSIRLKGYDYSQAGAYFITIVTQGRVCLFGDVIDGEMLLNDAGKMVRRVWDGIPDRFPSVEMDAFVVMPNHVHGVIFIHQPHTPSVGASLVGALTTGDVLTTGDARNDTKATTGVSPALGDVVGAYKSLTTLDYGKGVRETDWPPFHKRLWQRDYYERIIRNESETALAREYIANNPMKWELDRENPARTGSGIVPTEKTP